MNKSLPSEQQQQLKHRKTPQDFLGENANLVNLDQLVTKKESAGKELINQQHCWAYFQMLNLFQIIFEFMRLLNM